MVDSQIDFKGKFRKNTSAQVIDGNNKDDDDFLLMCNYKMSWGN